MTHISRLRTPAGITASIGTVLLAALIVLGPIVWGEAATATSVPDRLLGSSLEHPFGTDALGRDILARVLYATQLSVLLALGATAISVVFGVIVGLGATVLPPRLRRIVTALIDIMLAFPWLLLALFFSVIWGATATGAMLAVGFSGIPAFARLAYTLGSSVSGRDYVRVARIVGVGRFGVLLRHVLPNVANPLLVNTAATASVALLAFAGLSFLGLGVQNPEFDWGRLLREGTLRIYVNPMAAIGPGVAIVLTGIVFTLASEALALGRSRASVTPAGVLRGTSTGAFAWIQGRSRSRVATGPTDVVDTEQPAPVAAMAGLRVAFPAADGSYVERVGGVALSIVPGEVVGIVGESGSGKSLTAMALAGLLEDPARVTVDYHRFGDIDMASPLTQAEKSRLGAELAMVFQDPLTSLNPALTIGRQLTEVPEVHLKMGKAEALDRAERALSSVSIPEARRRLGQYPHQFSGGMRQRAMIGMALTGTPQLIIADEPTTALDVTVQKQVLAVLRTAQQATGAAIVFISHDIALVSAFCDRVVVMRDGRVVEQLDARRLQEDAKHPYTRALIACLPDMRSDRTRPLPTIGADAEEARA